MLNIRFSESEDAKIKIRVDISDWWNFLHESTESRGKQKTFQLFSSGNSNFFPSPNFMTELCCEYII